MAEVCTLNVLSNFSVGSHTFLLKLTSVWLLRCALISTTGFTDNGWSVALLSNSLYLFNKITLLLQEVGVSERRLVRRAGVLLVVIMMTAMMLMEQNDPVIASETDVLKGLIVKTTLAVLKTPF